MREQVYKTFKSFKLSDDPSELDDAQLNDLRRILSYWAVMGVFTFAEFFLDFFMSWIPFFFETKILFLVSSCLPQSAGSQDRYQNLLEM